ncbi:hypothetical protein BDN72DRAFT_221500 [Pluteus cervinus]|uniref:Uncharacterized protein n=1 Tax=Pluteus cervinus TaxID=181527 RepID=A0ACD3AGL2_9AGAR|nr:hypothetical protein BDN72DRAFT_221500 [Pluteus cervinus]
MVSPHGGCAILATSLLVFQPGAAVTKPGSLLVLRQATPPTGSVPPTCQSACAPVLGDGSNNPGVNNCPASQCCTAAFAATFESCILCVGTNAGVTNYTEPQQDLDSFVVQCDQNGFSVPELTLPGQNPDRPLPTGSVVSSTASSGPSESLSSQTPSAASLSSSSAVTPSITAIIPFGSGSPETPVPNTSSQGFRSTFSCFCAIGLVVGILCMV